MYLSENRQLMFKIELNDKELFTRNKLIISYLILY